VTRTPDLHRGHCFTCGTDCGPGEHVCPDPQYGPPPPPKPFVRRWDPIGALWVQCIVENGTAWEPRVGRYTPVQPEELQP
jgi:hypothetical protein